MPRQRSRGRESADSATSPGNDYRHGNDHLIDLRHVVKTYRSPAGEFTALKGVSLEVDHGEFVTVIGKSGSGKSTLINMITGIDRPTSGEVLVGDTAVHKLSEGRLAAWRGRNVGVIFQFFQLLPTLTVIENLMLPMDFCRMYSMRERRERAMYLLEQVELVEHARKLPSALSGGEQQRVAIARAMSNDPPILVADEPTGNLDSKTAETIFQIFERLVSEGKTILMVTHDQDLAQRATRTIILSDGEIIEEYLAEAFPALTEDQLIEATRHLDMKKCAPGEVIIQEGVPHDDFYVVTRGYVDVHVQTSDGQQFLVARLGSGQYFGEIALLRGGASRASVRAGTEGPVYIAALDREAFERMVTESQSTRQELDQVAQERIEKNIAAAQGGSDA